MSVKFKFRSSTKLDSIDLSGRSCITISELKLEVMRRNHLKLSQDYDLVFSDADTGKEYNDENIQVASGSTIIVKRVPAGSRPLVRVRDAAAINFGTRDSDSMHDTNNPPAKVEMHDTFELKNAGFEMENQVVRRHSDVPLTGQVPEVGDPTQFIIRETEGDKDDVKPNSTAQDYWEFERYTQESADLPPELKCSLCVTSFKDAVMIPCCQNSFCEQCIHRVLLEKKKCPICSSAKCRVNDLLPNVSLRQAIENFRHNKILFNGSENELAGYASDVESGIHAKSVPHVASVSNQALELPASPSATGMGSNQIEAEYGYQSRLRVNAFMVCDCNQLTGFQGCDQPFHTSQAVQEVHSGKGQEGAWVNFRGGEQNSGVPDRHKMRACYKCGSTGHLMRECPMPVNSNPIYRNGNAIFPGAMPGYCPPYWHGSPVPPSGPFQFPYRGPAVITYHVDMGPATPFGVPSYGASMYGGYPAPSGSVRMGSTPIPYAINAEHPPGYSEHLELKEHRECNEDIQRKWSCSGDKKHGELERSQGHKSHKSGERSTNISGGSYTIRSVKKHRHGKHSGDDADSTDEKGQRSSRSRSGGKYHKIAYKEKLTPKISDTSGNPIWHGEERHKHHHRSCRKHDERRGRHESDSRGHHHYIERGSKKKHMEKDREKHRNYPEPDSEDDNSGDYKKPKTERESHRESRHLKQDTDSREKLCHERRKMDVSSNDNYRRNYHSGKRNTVK